MKSESSFSAGIFLVIDAGMCENKFYSKNLQRFQLYEQSNTPPVLTPVNTCKTESALKEPNFFFYVLLKSFRLLSVHLKTCLRLRQRTEI